MLKPRHLGQKALLTVIDKFALRPSAPMLHLRTLCWVRDLRSAPNTRKLNLTQAVTRAMATDYVGKRAGLGDRLVVELLQRMWRARHGLFDIN